MRSMTGIVRLATFPPMLDPQDDLGRTLQTRTWTREMLHALVAERLGNRKLIVVANREPYIHRYDGTQIECIRPASGMATALHPMMIAAGGTWIAHGSGDADRAVVDEQDRLQVPPEDPAY